VTHWPTIYIVFSWNTYRQTDTHTHTHTHTFAFIYIYIYIYIWWGGKWNKMCEDVFEVSANGMSVCSLPAVPFTFNKDPSGIGFGSYFSPKWSYWRTETRLRDGGGSTGYEASAFCTFYWPIRKWNVSPFWKIFALKGSHTVFSQSSDRILPRSLMFVLVWTCHGLQPIQQTR
jgi:hypothetical protein